MQLKLTLRHSFLLVNIVLDRPSYLKKAQYTTRTARVWVENNIIVVDVFENTVMDLSDAEENLRMMDKLFPLIKPDDAYSLLVDIQGLKSVGKEAVDLLISAGNRTDKSASAIAMIVKSPLERIIGNFIMNFKSLKKPTQLFSNRDKAIKWLNTIIHKQELAGAV